MVTVANVLEENGHRLWFVTPDSTVKDAIQIMTDYELEALPVMEDGNLVGIFSQLDFFTKMIKKRRLTEEMPVREIMTSNNSFATPGQSVEDCLALMAENHLRYLPVKKGASLVGLLSKSDVLGTIVSDQKDYIYRLENYVLGADYAR